jgi:GNAT superfamily N-acetyltransferase
LQDITLWPAAPRHPTLTLPPYPGVCYAGHLRVILNGATVSYDIEEVERAALEDLSAAATDELAAVLRKQSAIAGSAFVSLFAALPATAIVVNRTIGLGLSRPETKDTIDAVVDLYAKAGVARYFVHVHPESRPGDIGDWLVSRGLERARSWMKFRRGREAPPKVTTSLAVRPAAAKDAEGFGRIVADAFDLGAAGAPLLARLIGRPDWHIFMSFDGDQPAGAGALYVKHDIGWLDWAATAPAYRRRGSQSALMRRRIIEALDLGCRLIVTATGEAVPGDPQISYKNILKMGFEPTYLRENYAPPR